MSLATSNRDGGRTSESGHLRAIQKVITGEVLTGLNVSQRSAGANMSVDVAIGDAIIPRADGTYGHPAWNDAVYNQVIGTADVSNPRRDIVVMYIDYSVTPSTGVSNNTNGVVKISVVAGTPAGSPVDPSDAAIQSAVGASNPFIKLARVRVAAGATSITNSVIDDLRLMATGVEQGGWIYDDMYTWTYASSTSFTVAGVDVTAQFPVGTRIALYQSGSIKYFTVIASVFSTNTTITLDGGATYTLANVPIDRPAYSYYPRPSGYPFQSIDDPLGGFQELGRVTLASPSGTVSVSGLPPRKYLKIYVRQVPSGGTISGRLRFNGDTAANYASKYSLDLSAMSTDASSVVGIIISNTKNQNLFSVTDVLNVANSEKLTNTHSTGNPTAGAANAPEYILGPGKWANTSVQISTVSLNNTGAGTFGTGTEIVVFGKN
jgi:hypothetical protein